MQRGSHTAAPRLVIFFFHSCKKKKHEGGLGTRLRNTHLELNLRMHQTKQDTLKSRYFLPSAPLGIAMGALIKLRLQSTQEDMRARFTRPQDGHCRRPKVKTPKLLLQTGHFLHLRMTWVPQLGQGFFLPGLRLHVCVCVCVHVYTYECMCVVKEECDMYERVMYVCGGQYKKCMQIYGPCTYTSTRKKAYILTIF